jgi:hypothetical protein
MPAIDLTKPACRRDWASYLIAADQAEESGNDALAARLRRRGEALRTLVEAVREAAARSGRRQVNGRLPEYGRFALLPSFKLVRLLVAPDSLKGEGLYLKPLHLHRDCLASRKRPHYLVDRIIDDVFPLLES